MKFDSDPSEEANIILMDRKKTKQFITYRNITLSSFKIFLSKKQEKKKSR